MANLGNLISEEGACGCVCGRVGSAGGGRFWGLIFRGVQVRIEHRLVNGAQKRNALGPVLEIKVGLRHVSVAGGVPGHQPL